MNQQKGFWKISDYLVFAHEFCLKQESWAKEAKERGGGVGGGGRGGWRSQEWMDRVREGEERKKTKRERRKK